MQLVCIGEHDLGTEPGICRQHFTVGIRVRGNEPGIADKPLPLIDAGTDAGAGKVPEVTGGAGLAAGSSCDDGFAGGVFRLLFKCRSYGQHGTFIQVGQALDPGDHRRAECQCAGLVKDDMAAVCQCFQTLVADDQQAVSEHGSGGRTDGGGRGQ